MYSKSKISKDVLVHSKSRYIEGFDLNNSKLLHLLPTLKPTITYSVKIPEFDRISLDVYGESNYHWMVARYLGIKRSNLYTGLVIKLPSLTDIHNLINSL